MENHLSFFIAMKQSVYSYCSGPSSLHAFNRSSKSKDNV